MIVMIFPTGLVVLVGAFFAAGVLRFVKIERFDFTNSAGVLSTFFLAKTLEIALQLAKVPALNDA